LAPISILVYACDVSFAVLLLGYVLIKGVRLKGLDASTQQRVRLKVEGCTIRCVLPNLETEENIVLMVCIAVFRKFWGISSYSTLGYWNASSTYRSSRDFGSVCNRSHYCPNVYFPKDFNRADKI